MHIGRLKLGWYNQTAYCLCYRKVAEMLNVYKRVEVLVEYYKDRGATPLPSNFELVPIRQD